MIYDTATRQPQKPHHGRLEDSRLTATWHAADGQTASPPTTSPPSCSLVIVIAVVAPLLHRVSPDHGPSSSRFAPDPGLTANSSSPGIRLYLNARASLSGATIVRHTFSSRELCAAPRRSRWLVGWDARRTRGCSSPCISIGVDDDDEVHTSDVLQHLVNLSTLRAMSLAIFICAHDAVIRGDHKRADKESEGTSISPQATGAPAFGETNQRSPNGKILRRPANQRSDREEDPPPANR
jgi:hypothetical protein